MPRIRGGGGSPMEGNAPYEDRQRHAVIVREKIRAEKSDFSSSD